MKLNVLLLGVVLAGLVGVARGVSTKHWHHRSAEDFRGSTTRDVVITNFGDVRLARELRSASIDHADVSAVFCLHAAPNGRVFAGTGPSGVVLQVQPGETREVVRLGDGVQVFALASDRDGRLLVAASGERGRVLRVGDDGKTTELFGSDEDVFIWSIWVEPDGKLLLATGPNGRLLEVDPTTRTAKTLFDCEESNLLSMAIDPEGNILVGTDPGGLIYRVNRKTGRGFALFDADESEIGAIVVAADGTIYAATSQAVSGEASETPSSEGVGRPRSGPTVPLPMPEPQEPKPPEVPEPPQILPDPIPRQAPATQPHAASFPLEDRIELVAFQEAAEDTPSPDATPTQPSGAHATGGGPPPPAQNLATDNAVYLIDRTGFTRELWRGNAVILAMAWQQDHLLLATGNDGMIFQLKPGDDEVAPIARTDSQQVSALLTLPDGRAVVGLSNPPAIGTLNPGLVKEGSFTSAPLDAGQVSLFGRLRLTGSLPAGTSLAVQTRSGNVADPNALGWSEWSPPQPAQQFVPIGSPGARFLQYRLVFRGDGTATPQVEELEISYQMPNQPPLVKAIVIADPQRSERAAIREISWEASDPNDDALQYSVWLRGSPTGPWVLLKERLAEPRWEWDSRTVADGRYRLKIVASDALANAVGEGRTAERISESLLIDNEPPVIGDLKFSRQGRELKVSVRLIDRTGSIASLEYALSGRDDWQRVFPEDIISDSPEERYAFVVPLTGDGVSVLSLRATDAAGNASHQTIEIPAAR